MVRCPVSMGLCVASLLVFVVQQLSLVDPVTLDALYMGPRAFDDQPWGFFLALLPHGGPLHLLFNAYFTWQLGTRIEYVLGPWRMLALVLLIALPTSAAQYAFSGGAIGLSGVVYGFVALLFVLDRNDRRFRGAIDPRTVQWFVMWFFLAIVLSQIGPTRIAHIAHGAGALVGWLIGVGASSSTGRRLAAGGALVVLTVLLGVAGTQLGPEWHLDPYDRVEDYWNASAKLQHDDPERARDYLVKYTEWLPNNPEAWHHIGRLSRKIGDLETAAQADERAEALGWQGD